MMEKKFSYQSADIFYYVYGEGKTVVLLHGFGEDHHIWNLQIPFLEKHCRLIVPDIPGSGKSGLLTGNDVSMSDYADCIHALLKHEKISNCIMLGHSMGGYITMAFAEKYASMLESYGLIHSTAFADSEEKKQFRERSINMMETYGAHAFLKPIIPNLFSASFRQAHTERINELVASVSYFTKEALQQYYRAMILRPDRSAVFSSNRLPVLFVIGKEDTAIPMQDVLQQISLPAVSYIYIGDMGHMGMWEATEKLNRQVLAFINH